MKLFFFLFTLCATAAHSASLAERSLKVCVAGTAPVEVRAAAQKVLAAVAQAPLLKVMAGAKSPRELTDSQVLAGQPAESRAYDHLVIIGLADDPLISAAWQREARIEHRGIYVFGLGHFEGDIGYVESDRNPFLHGRAIASAPYETEIVVITGTTARGVALAVDSFLNQQLLNGAVALPGWKRTKPNLLSRDPLAPDFHPPTFAPPQLGKFIRLGVTQLGEDVYRAVLVDAGASPKMIWQVKYYAPPAWDGAGAKSALEAYSAGLHRRAAGNSLWCAQFESAGQATMAAGKIASAGKLRPSGNGSYVGVQAMLASNDQSPGPLSLLQRGDWLILSTLPAAETNKITNH